MQFSCESCRATLHIGDEKVKGKRLVVRCKKCGARIQIADPALGPPPVGAAPLSAAPVKAARAEEPKPRSTGDSDTESTQAMDSGVLEQALRASKIDDSTLDAGLARLSGAQLSRPPPPPESRAPSPRDPAIWFAMVAGKQAGPLSRAELALKVGQGQITPRTYLWKEGMAGWQRAQEVGELAALFGPPPSKPPPSSNTLPPPVPSTRSARESAALAAAELELGGQPQAPLASAPPEEARRGRQRQEPEFAKSAGLEPSERPLSSSASNLALELGSPPAAERPAPAPQKSAPQKSAPLKPVSSSRAVSLFAPEREMSRDPLAPTPEADDDDRTHVEPLPLGERVHQEAVANELFSSGAGESSAVSASAKDLASWASQELGRRPPASSNLPKAPVPSLPSPPRASGPSPLPDSVAPTLGGAALGDPFANVPDAPGFSAPNPVDTTGNIIARSGVKKSRAGTLVLLIGGVVLVLGALLVSLTVNNGSPGPAQVEAQRQALGGTGQSVSGLIQGTTSGLAAAPQPDAARSPSKRAAAADKATAADKAKAEEAAQDAQALAALDNERGIGNHGPKVDAVATPDTAKADASLSADDIKKKLGENKGALQSCIDEALRKEPDLRVGKIHIATTIAPSGTVISAHIDKKSVDDSPLGACLKRATKRIVFPAFSGEAFEVDIPILVTAGD